MQVSSEQKVSPAKEAATAADQIQRPGLAIINGQPTPYQLHFLRRMARAATRRFQSREQGPRRARPLDCVCETDASIPVLPASGQNSIIGLAIPLKALILWRLLAEIRTDAEEPLRGVARHKCAFASRNTGSQSAGRQRRIEGVS